MPKRLTEQAQNYSGALDTKSNPQALKNEDVAVSENMRIEPTGGRFTRKGFLMKASLGTSAKVDTMETMDMFDVLFAKSDSKIKQSVDGVTWYDIGLTRTSSEREAMHPYGKNMYATNQTDAFTRIAVTTLAADISAGATSFSTRGGDGVNFSTGTWYIDGEAITVTGLSTDAATCNATSSAHSAGAIVTQTSTPSGAPSGSCITDFKSRLIVGGVKSNPKTIYYSGTETTANPEFAYDFTANGAGSREAPSDITALLSGNNICLIGMKKGIDFAFDFNVDTGGLETRPLTSEQGIPNAFCLAQLGPRFYAFTTGNRVLPIVAENGAAAILDDPNNPFASFDYRMRGILDEADTDQTLSFIHADPVKNELSVVPLLTGITHELIWDGDSAKWVSDDTGKNFSCKANFLKQVYAGSDSTDSVYLDEGALTDDTIPIFHRIVSKEYHRGGLVNKYIRFTFSGLLSALGEFTFRVYLDHTLHAAKLITAQDLVTAGLMTFSSGTPIGRGAIGAKAIGSSGVDTEGFDFTYPYFLVMTGQSVQFEWEVNNEGTGFQLNDSFLEYETPNIHLLPSQ